MTSLNPLPATKALDTYFLDVRSKILDVAAAIDRINRGRDVAAIENDPRMSRVRQALGVLLDQTEGRAQRVQQVFSLEYQPAWEKPVPR